MLGDTLPTGFECGLLNGQVQPGDVVAIVGAGPVGLAALLTAQFYSPASILMIDPDDKRLDVAKAFGATALINSTDGGAVQRVMDLTAGQGVDVAIEAVGAPATFDICPKSCGTETSPSRRAWSTPARRHCSSKASCRADYRRESWSPTASCSTTSCRHTTPSNTPRERAR